MPFSIRWATVGVATALAVAGCSADTAGRRYDVDSAIDVRTAGELVATADAVVHGRVVDVTRGPATGLTDGSGATTAPRLLTIAVDQRLHEGSGRIPDEIEVSDGFWRNGEGYEPAGLPWAQPGDEGWFVVTEGEAGAYDVLTVSGRVLDSEDGPAYSPESLWAADERAPLDRGEFLALLDVGIEQAASGAASPVRVPVCEPSTPGDEDSPPVCTEE